MACRVHDVLPFNNYDYVFSPGLQLSLKGHKQAFVSFTYQLSPLMEHAVHIDWKVLTAEGVECQHVRYHQLQPGDTLNDLASKYRKAHAVAIILVNTENSLELAAEFCQNVVRNKKTTFPLIVISSEDGKSLREFLNRHDPGELQARVESKNQLHVELQKKTRATGSSSPGSQSKSGSKLQRGALFSVVYNICICSVHVCMCVLLLVVCLCVFPVVVLVQCHI